MKKYFVIGAMIVLLIGCAASARFQPAPAELPAMQQKVPDISLEEAQKGFSLYKTNCSGCHSLHKPGKYSIDEWNKILPEMFEKAKMTAQNDTKSVKDYLHSMSK